MKHAQSEPAQPAAVSDSPTVTVSAVLAALGAELGVALRDVDGAVEELEQAFMGLSSHHSGGATSPAASVLGCEHQAIAALQFHDRLEQRIQHVRSGLRQVASVLEIAGGSSTPNEQAWTQLAHSLGNGCPVEEDKQEFLQTCRLSTEDAVRPAMPTAGSVELFP